jgi:predicted ArsR family transcriptional regulator
MEIMGPTPARSGGTPALSPQRARVLEHVQRSDTTVTVGEVAARLGLHPNTARKHLDALVAQDLVASGLVPTDGPGRPARSYVAAPRTEPDPRVRDYAALATALAGHVARTSADPRADALAAGDAWGRALVEGRPRGRGSARARGTVVTLLAELGFDPQSDASARTVRLRRCPLLDVARALPDVVCAVHLGLVRGALDALGGEPRTTALAPFAEPGACLLQLRTPEPRSAATPTRAPRPSTGSSRWANEP